MCFFFFSLISFFYFILFLPSLCSEFRDVLFIGDSVDRGVIVGMCELFNGSGSNWAGSLFDSHSNQWDNKRDHPLNEYPKSFPRSSVNYFSDLRCTLESQNIRINQLHVFGSADFGPYNLGLCDGTSLQNGNFCDTSIRIPAAIRYLQRETNLRAVFFQSVLWDVHFVHITESSFKTNIEKRLNQLKAVLPTFDSLIVRTAPIKPQLMNGKARRIRMFNNVLRNVSASLNILLFDWEKLVEAEDFLVSADHPAMSASQAAGLRMIEVSLRTFLQ